MTYCPGSGDSEIQPSVTNTAIAFVAGALSLALIEILPPPFNVVAAGYIGAITFDLSNFCTHDPPAMPSTGDIATAAFGLLGSPTARLAAIAVFEDFVGASTWSTYCQCVTGPQPTPPSPPAAPTNLPSASVPATTGTPCANTFPAGILDTAGSESATHPLTTFLLPVNATSVEFNVFVDDNGNSGAEAQFFVSFYTAAGGTFIESFEYGCYTPATPTGSQSFAAHALFNGGGGSDNVGTLISGNQLSDIGLYAGAPVLTLGVPVSAAQVQISYRNIHTASAALRCYVAMSAFCGGASGETNGCCPPDSSIISALASLQATLDALTVSLPTNGVTSYASGTAHAGLTGYGALSFADAAIGVKVNITAAGPAVGQVIGDPTFYFNAGYINLVTEQGTLAGVRLEYDGQFIPFPALVASLTYTLGPGITATITEVTAGP